MAKSPIHLRYPSNKKKRKIHLKSNSDDYRYVVQSLRDPLSQDESELSFEQVPLSDLLKLAVKEVDEIEDESLHALGDDEFRLKQHLWQFILKIKSMNSSQENNEKDKTSLKFSKSSHSPRITDYGYIREEDEENDDSVDSIHPRKKFKDNHSHHHNISISAPSIYYIENEKGTLNPLIYQTTNLSNYLEQQNTENQHYSKRKNRHSDKRQQLSYLSSNNSNDTTGTTMSHEEEYLMLNLDEYEEEIALIKVDSIVSYDTNRCPAPDPIAMLYGIDRYKVYSNNESDSEKEENED